MRGDRGEVGLGPAQLEERADQHRLAGCPRAAAGDLDLRRGARWRGSAQISTDPIVVPGPVGDQPQARRVHPGDPAVGQPGDPVRAARGVQQPPGQRGRQQVRGARQPDRLARR